MDQYASSKGMESRFPTQRVSLPLSDAARASLTAVRAAQEAARERARRQTWKTRAWLGGIIGGLAFGMVVFGARPAPRTRVTAAGTATGMAPIQTPAPRPSASIATAPEVGASTTGSATRVEPPSAAAAAATAQADNECTESFSQPRRHLAVEACAQSFAAHPTEASLALRLAQAYHARARLGDAAEWANRAVALDPKLAEAFVIIAHEERRAGHADAAVDAYQRYLALAPRGWHAHEARAAVREQKQAMHPAAATRAAKAIRQAVAAPRAEPTGVPAALTSGE